MRPLLRRIATLPGPAGLLLAGWLVTGPAPPAATPSQVPVAAAELLTWTAAAHRARSAHAHLTAHRAGHHPAWVIATDPVPRGATLTSLAAHWYHHPSWWPRIWWVNRRLIPNPDVLPAGAHLVIPYGRPPRPAVVARAWGAIPPPPPPPAPPVPPAPPPQAPAAAPAPPPPPAASTSYSAAPGSFQACVIQAESGGNASAVNASSGAGGLYGFLPSTWQSLGHSGLPENASVAEQNQAFAQEYAQGGTSAWAPYDGC